MLTNWIPKTLRIWFKMAFAEAILARLLMEDAEWAFFEPFLTAVRGRGERPASNHRRILDAIFWTARTGSPWRDLPEEFGKWSSVYLECNRYWQQHNRTVGRNIERAG